MKFKEYHDFYVQGETLLADVFENFQNMCLKIYELDPAHFLSTPRLIWKTALKNTKEKFDLLTDNKHVNTVENGLRGGTCHSIYRSSRANSKYMKYKKDKK